MHTRKCTRTVHTCIYMKCSQQTPVRTSFLSTNFDLLEFIICFNNPQIGHNITIKLRFSMIFQNKIQTNAFILYCTRTIRVLYHAKRRHCTCSVGSQYSVWHMLYSVVHCIKYIYCIRMYCS